MDQPTPQDPQPHEQDPPVDPDEEEYQRYGETTSNYLFQPEPW